MDEYTGKVSKMGKKRVVNVPRSKFNEFKAGTKVSVKKKPREGQDI